MALTYFARRLRAVAILVMSLGCSHRHPAPAPVPVPAPVPAPANGNWTSELAVRPGSTLPPADAPQRQAITLFEVSQQRDVDKQFFIAGVGYVAINGGGSTLAGYNRALDPFIELTIADRNDPALTTCRDLLVPASFAGNAVRISGSGNVASLPGVQSRQLVVVRLLTIAECTLVPRR